MANAVFTWSWFCKIGPCVKQTYSIVSWVAAMIEIVVTFVTNGTMTVVQILCIWVISICQVYRTHPSGIYIFLGGGCCCSSSCSYRWVKKNQPLVYLTRLRELDWSLTILLKHKYYCIISIFFKWILAFSAFLANPIIRISEWPWSGHALNKHWISFMTFTRTSAYSFSSWGFVDFLILN